MRHPRRARFRFYAELNDFLPKSERGAEIEARFEGQPAIKDTIESLGVPHAEIDLILVNGEAVGFDHRVKDGDRVAVYPVFERFDIGGLSPLRERPLRDPRFICDANLGRLARSLRLLGFDTLYDSGSRSDPEIVDEAQEERRIILTRDIGLLKHARVTHGLWVRARAADAQLEEIVERLDLRALVRPWTRCLLCNGALASVTKDEVIDQLPERTKETFDAFRRCTVCRRIYWRGAHADRLAARIQRILGQVG